MRIVEICRRRPEDAEIERVGRVVVAHAGEPAVLEPLIPQFADGLTHIMAEGIADERGRPLHLGDGEAFLDALPTFYRGSRFWAREVTPADEG